MLRVLWLYHYGNTGWTTILLLGLLRMLVGLDMLLVRWLLLVG